MSSSNEKTAAQEAKLKNDARLKLYNKVVDEAKLRKLLLSELTFKVNREIDTNAVKPKMGFSGRMVEFSSDLESGTIAATIEWSVLLKSGRRTFAKCAARYHVIYDGFTIRDEEILERFAFNVGRPATYTYFRTLFASLDWASELRNPPLPVVKFFPKV